MGFFGKIRNGVNRFGKKLVGAAKSVGKFVDRYGRKITSAVGTAGEYINKYAPLAGEVATVIAPEYAGQIQQAVGTAQTVGGALQTGAKYANKGLDVYDKIKGMAGRQGLVNGSPDVNGSLTTPAANSVAHESRSNVQQKGSMINSKKRKAIGQFPSSAMVSQDITTVKPAGKPVASGPLAGMSSEMAADKVMVAKRKSDVLKQGPDRELSMPERYNELKAASGPQAGGDM